MSARAACVVCGAREVSRFLTIESVPVLCNQLRHTRDEALGAARGPLVLGFCPDCGHIFNLEFDPALLEYSPEYENSLYCSGLFREYADSLVDALVARYALNRRTVVEIGCGRGDFLNALCSRGGNRGIGFDPGCPDDSERAGFDGRIEFRRQSFGRSDAPRFDADFVCSRHTLEHVAEPRVFLTNIRRACLQPGVPVFIEVPNALHTLKGGAWDLIYEHCSYFTPSSLARVLAEAGYEVVAIEPAFDGQFLTAHARTAAALPAPVKPASPTPAELSPMVHEFAETYRRQVREWTERLHALASGGRKVVAWGAGAKGIAFLNALRPSGAIDYIVDLNPRKHGKYTTGSGQMIVAPDFLREYRPDFVIVMNRIYMDEIRRTTIDLGLNPQLLPA